MLKYLYLGANYLVYASTRAPTEEQADFFIIELELMDPTDLENIITIVQATVEVTQLQLSRDMHLPTPDRSLN